MGLYHERCDVVKMSRSRRRRSSRSNSRTLSRSGVELVAALVTVVPMVPYY